MGSYRRYLTRCVRSRPLSLVAEPGGFHLPNPVNALRWNTPESKAAFKVNPLPSGLLHERVLATGQTPDLILQTLRSHDQYNTTIYGLDDRYRGVHGTREVVFANALDIRRLGFEPGQKVDLIALWEDGIERRVNAFTLLDFDVPVGQAAAYYPETNPLVALDSYGAGSFTPASKFIAVRVQASQSQPSIKLVE